MKVTGSTIQQLEKDKPRNRCRKWRLWATTDEGRKSRRFHGTYSQACDALKAFVSELEGIVPNSDTFASYAASWLAWRVESGDLSPNTVRAESASIGALCRTELAGMRMDEIDAQACREALLWLKAHPKRCSEYSAHTMSNHHSTLSLVMKQAVDDGKLAANPMSGVRRPKVRRAEMTALSPDELSLLLNRLDERGTDGFTMALYLMACLGLRCGEVCALRDDEVSGGFARITSTVREADNSVGPAKTESGVRTLPLPPRLAAKVDEWREIRKALGFADSETLCCNTRGGVMSTSSLRQWWERTRADIGCDGMVLHELRHSNLSMMARHISVFDLQRYAGWASIAPARIYVHDDLDAVARAVELAWQ